MFAFSSAQVRTVAGGLSEAPPAQRRSLAGIIGHGLAIGAAATVLQLLLLLALLYVSGIIES